MSQNLQGLRDYLYWLVTPQNEEEAKIFRHDPDMIDEQCRILNRLDTMTEQELIDEINAQLEPQGLAIAPTKFSDN